MQYVKVMVNETDKKKLLDFLKSKSVAVISTVSASNQPEAATIYFAVDDDLTFYFMTKSFTRKYDNITSNNAVALVVGTENEPATAQIQGTVMQINDKEALTKRLEQLKAVFTKNDYVGPLFELVGEQNEILLYKVIPFWIRFLDMRGHDNDHNEFVQILP